MSVNRKVTVPLGSSAIRVQVYDPVSGRLPALLSPGDEVPTSSNKQTREKSYGFGREG